MFWPSLAPELVSRRHDGQPLVTQEYSLPKPKYDEFRDHDMAIYSVWNHFIRFCLKNSDQVFEEDYSPINQITGKPRLRIFRQLSSHEATKGSPKSPNNNRGFALSPRSDFHIVKDSYFVGSEISDQRHINHMTGNNYAVMHDKQGRQLMEYSFGNIASDSVSWHELTSIRSVEKKM